MFKDLVNYFNGDLFTVYGVTIVITAELTDIDKRLRFTFYFLMNASEENYRLFVDDHLHMWS